MARAPEAAVEVAYGVRSVRRLDVPRPGAGDAADRIAELRSRLGADDADLLDSLASILEEHAELSRTVRQLQDGMISNREIGKAVGLLMAQYRLDDAAAFAKLRDHSRDLNIKVRVLAEQIITHHNSGCERTD